MMLMRIVLLMMMTAEYGRWGGGGGDGGASRCIQLMLLVMVVELQVVCLLLWLLLLGLKQIVVIVVVVGAIADGCGGLMQLLADEVTSGGVMADRFEQRCSGSLMHLGTVMAHAEAGNVQVVRIVVRLRGTAVVVITAAVVVVVLGRLALRVLFVLHAPVLEPYFDLRPGYNV